MNRRDLFEAIGQVDADLVEDADAPMVKAGPKRAVLRRLLPLAACLCLAAGAVLAWRAAPWGGTAAGNEAAPQLAAATAPEETEEPSPELYAGGAEGAARDEAAPEMETAPRDSACDSAGTGIPTELAQAITPAAGGDGGGPVLAAGTEELVGGLPGSTGQPDTMVLYRSTLADGGIDEDGMRQTMACLLEALGLDPALADGAELVYNVSASQVEDAGHIAAGLEQQFGSGSAMAFWAGIARLELDLPGGGSITVRNDRGASVSLAGRGALQPIARENLAANSSLLEALGGFSLAGWQGAGRSWQDGSLLPGQLALYRPGAPGRITGAQVDGTGALASFDLSGAAWAEPAGSFPVIDRPQAEELLYGGAFLNAGSAERSPADGTIADARLCYLDGTARYYTPVWRFVVDFGVPDAGSYPTADPDTGAALHAYGYYYVPAIDLDTLAGAVAAG